MSCKTRNVKVVQVPGGKSGPYWFKQVAVPNLQSSRKLEHKARVEREKCQHEARARVYAPENCEIVCSLCGLVVGTWQFSKYGGLEEVFYE